MKNKKKENPLPPPPPLSPSSLADTVYSAKRHELRMKQVQEAIEVVEERRVIRFEERRYRELMIANMKAMMAAPAPPPVTQLMMRETLDKEGKVMTREYIPVPRRSAS